MTDEISRAIIQVDEASAQLSQRDIDDIEQLSKRFATYSSEVLVGIAGAILGGAVGIAVPLGATVVLTGPAGAALGAALALIRWRGNPVHRAEKEHRRHTIRIAELNRQLENLPPSAPAYVQDALWDAYVEEINLHRRLLERLPALPANLRQ